MDRPGQLQKQIQNIKIRKFAVINLAVIKIDSSTAQPTCIVEEGCQGVVHDTGAAGVEADGVDVFEECRVGGVQDPQSEPRQPKVLWGAIVFRTNDITKSIHYNYFNYYEIYWNK